MPMMIMMMIRITLLYLSAAEWVEKVHPVW
jgi:hypothetical protein